jgi:hypothetical protein
MNSSRYAPNILNIQIAAWSKSSVEQFSISAIQQKQVKAT